MSIKKIRIFDMDGTIVCSLHRYRTIKHADGIERIDLQHWRENEHRAMDDSLLPMAEEYKRTLMCPDTFTIIATARVINTPDQEFIEKILGRPDHIISRAANDTRSGALLKVLGLRKLFALKQFQNVDDIIFYEDNVSYLKTVCDEFGFTGVYVPSRQGH